MRSVDGRLRAPGCVSLMAVLCGLLACHGAVIAGQAERPSSPNAPQTIAPLPVATDDSGEGLSVEAVQAHLKAAETNKEFDDATRAKLVDIYNRVLQQLKLAETARTRGAAFSTRIESAPEELRRLKEQAPPPPEGAAAANPADVPLAEAQQTLSQAEAKLAEHQKNLADLQNEPKHRADRRIETPRRQEELRKQIEEIDRQLATPPAPDAGEGGAAARLLLKARRLASDRELHAVQLELAAYEATSELLAAQRDQAVQRESQAEQTVKKWQDAVNARRQQEAQKQAREAERTAAQADPAIQALAGENAKLAAEREECAKRIEQATKLSKQLEAQTERLTAQFDQVKQRAKRVGLSETIGQLLRKHLENLPNIREQKRRVEGRRNEIASLSLRLLELEDARAGLADVDAVTADRIAAIPDSVAAGDRPVVERELRQLILTQRDYLDSLIADTNRNLDRLLEVNAHEGQLIAQAEEFEAYAEENVFWIRSAGPPEAADLQRAAGAASWLISRENWGNAAQTVARDARENRASYAVFAVLAVLILALQTFWRRRLRDCGREASKRLAIRFRPTAAALVLTLVLAAEWPVFLWLCGWRLVDLGNETGFVFALGTTLQGLAALLLTIELFRQVSRKEGLGESHFGWSAGSLRAIRANLRWLLSIGLPAAGIVLMTEAQTDEGFKSSLGRGAFIIALLLVAHSAYRMWHAPGGLPQGLFGSDADSRSRRFERLWRLATIAGPVVLATLAALGYYYTAVRLTSWMVCTIWLLLGVVILHAVTMRWLLLAYRELAFQRARQRRAAEAAAAAAAAGSEEKPPLADAAAPEPNVSLSDISQQTRNLARLAMYTTLFIGTWLIWSGVLPALSILKRVELWPQPFTLLEAPAAGEAHHGILTLAELALAIVVALVTVAAARNIPGLLELTVLRRLSVEASVRYAITTVSRYLITVAGIVATFGQLGIGWGDVQWLVAAVSVGLGFGLQEIFGNFVSGLILLFERPIRIGDIVSVGDVTGKISRIRMRATTITDWDMRELIVPNKELMTGRVINWTLTDTTARMTIHVNAAYGSDPDEVRQILLRVARAHPQILTDPAPHALFDDFGESSLNFTMRVYMTSLDAYLQVRHDLHTAIAAAFRQAGIEMPFPQRDLRLRDSADLIAAIDGAASRGEARRASPAAKRTPIENPPHISMER